MSKRTNSEREEEEAEKLQLAEYDSDSGTALLDAYVFDRLAKASKKKGDEPQAAKYTDMADDSWVKVKGNDYFGSEPHGTGEPESPAVLRALQLEPESAEKASELYGRYVDKPYRRRTGAELNEILGPDSGPVGLFEPSSGATMMDEMDDEANNLDLGFDYNENLSSTPNKEKGGRLRKKTKHRRSYKRIKSQLKMKRTRRKGRKATKRRHNRRK